MNAEQFFNNGFGADVEKVHRKQVIDLMTNFAKHYHTEQCNIANVVGQSEQLVNFLLHLNSKELINDHDFDYEKEAKRYLKKIN